LLFMFYSFYLVSPGQSVYYPISIPNLYSAKIGEAVNNTFISAFNPAMITFSKGFETGLFCEKKYMLEDVDLVVFSACASFGNNGFALLAKHFGNNDFYERIAGLNYGKSLGRLNIGMMVQYVNVKAGNGHNEAMIQAGFSSILKISHTHFAGIKIINPRIFGINPNKTIHAASSVYLGFGWQASELVYVGIESIKEEDRPPAFIFSLQYQFHQKLSAGFNWSTPGNLPFLSAGWKLKNVKIEAGCSYHMYLGPSPSITLMFKKMNSATPSL
jgi:hypothetical protein